jgi:hypothetical protein
MTKARLVEVRRDASHLETKYLSSSFLRTQTISPPRRPRSVTLLLSAARVYARKSSIVNLRRREIAIRTTLAPSPCGS